MSAISRGWKLDENKTRLDAVFGVAGATDPAVLFSMNATGVSFFDAAPAAQVADVLAAPAGGTGATAGAYDSAANRNLMIATVNGMRDCLRTFGLMA